MRSPVLLLTDIVVGGDANCRVRAGSSDPARETAQKRRRVAWRIGLDKTSRESRDLRGPCSMKTNITVRAITLFLTGCAVLLLGCPQHAPPKSTAPAPAAAQRVPPRLANLVLKQS